MKLLLLHKQLLFPRDTGGKISGGPAVIGDLVFYSNLSRRSTAAVGASTGKLVWSTGRGAFNPAISDGRRIYLVGYSSLFALGDRRTARRDARARARFERSPIARRDAANRRRARAERARKRSLQRRVQARRRAIRVNRARRRAGRRVCFTRDGRTTCRVPRPLVCVRQADDRTVCRPRRRT